MKTISRTTMKMLIDLPVSIKSVAIKAIAGACVLASTTVFGQTTRTWGGPGADLGAATNWVGGVVPATASGTTGDFATWDGTVAGNLTLTYNGNIAGGYQSSGVNFILTPTQTGSVTIISPVSGSANLACGQFWTNNSSSASFQLGDGSANVLNVIWRTKELGGDPDPFKPHYFVNNSTAPNVIWPNVKLQAGGGLLHTLYFGGTGDWYVTNNLTTINSVATAVGKQGSGTLVWAGPSISGALGNSVIASPLDFEGGTVVLKSGNPLSNQNITNNGVLKYDAPSTSQTLSGAIIGTGAVMVSSGTLTLSGASPYSGITVLTNSGTLILGSAHVAGTSGPIGVGGTIFFNGGTLQFSGANAYDYSGRFATGNNQAYSFNTGGQNVTFTNTLGSSGGFLVKSGSGTLTLAGTNSYTGSTTNNQGKLVIQGVKTGTGNIIVTNGATLGVYDAGTQVTPSTLALGSGGGATLEFNNVNNTSTAIIAASTLSASGAITVNVNSGNFTSTGVSYPLLTWTSGSAPTFVLGTLTGAGGNLSVSGNTLYLNITSLSYVWTGSTDGNWDLSTSGNWKAGGSPVVFADGGTALFDDTAPGVTNVTLNSAVSPGSVTVSASVKPYTITSSGANLIGGAGSLTKNGNSTLALSGGVNTYSGITTVAGGTLSVGSLANGGLASDIGSAGNGAANLVLNGGTLQYTGAGQSSDRLFTLGTGNGTLDASGSGALNLNNASAVALSGSGVRTLTLAGSSTADNTLAAAIGDNGGATTLTKSGTGKWILTGNNTNSGVTTISSGTLQIGAGGANGSLSGGNITANGTLIFNTTSTLTNGVVSGTGSLSVNSGVVVLPGDNTYSGGTTINGGTLRVGVGGATGSLANDHSIVDNGTIIFNSTGDFTLNGGAVISGSGNVAKYGSGLLKITGANTYTGWTYIDAGARLQISEGNAGASASSVITNNGLLLLTRQDTGVFIVSGKITGAGTLWKDNNNANTGDITLTGTNNYTGGTVIGGGNVIIGNGGTTGWIVGDVFFTNSLSLFDNPRTISFNHSDDITFSGNITYSTNLPFGNRGIVAQLGSGKLTLTGANTYPGGTTISAGILQVGVGGTNGAIGTGPVTDNATLIWNRSDNATFANTINGSGNLIKTGSGSLTLTATNGYTGTTTVSNGTLIINGISYAASTYVAGGTFGGTGTFVGPITMDLGTKFAPGDLAAIGTFTSYSDLTVGGDVSIKVNKSLAQSNDVALIYGSFSKTGTGTLTVVNQGPTLAAGDKFTLFPFTLPGGSALTIVGGNATWQNDLETDGSITVLSVSTVNPNPPVLQTSISGNSLSLGWPTNQGWTLQTNSVGLNAPDQWHSYPGSESLTNVTITINPAKTNVFFRMVYTNTP